jgi:hypothetical protein
MSFEYTGDGHQPLEARAPEHDATPPELDVAALRELHGRLLHGFALLIGLCDRESAGGWTAAALAAPAPMSDKLRHPERAAAWLRARVLSIAMSDTVNRGRALSDRAEVLEQLHVDLPLIDALSALDLRQRAALVAHDVERLDIRDVATVVGAHGEDLQRLLSHARAQLISAFTGEVPTDTSQGAIATKIRDAAARVLA